MLFKVLAGRHKQDDITYSKGDVVDTSMNLIEMFGDQRFQREFELEMAGKKAPIQTSAKVESKPEPEPEPEPEPKPVSLGDDLTARFSVARANKLLVFKKGNEFYVTTEDEPDKALNKKPLKRSDVVKFIEGKAKKD